MIATAGFPAPIYLPSQLGKRRIIGEGASLARRVADRTGKHR
jgi:hypothetical protein